MNPDFIDQVFASCGGRQVVLDALGLSKQSLSGWKRIGHVPAKHAVAVERLSGIHRSRLCPEFDWGETQESAVSAAS